MANAPRKQSEAQETAVPYLEPDFCDEPKTEPRIRMPLLIPGEQSGVIPRTRTLMSELKRFRFVPALVLGAALGSAPYLVQQHLRTHSIEALQALSRQQTVKESELETTQLAAANAPGSLAPQLYAAAAPEQALVRAQPADSLAAPSYIKLALSEPHPRRQLQHGKLTLERALLMQARRQLKSGDGLGAQLALERLNQTVPHGTQLRERKLLEIQVLLAIGAKDRARAAARDFASAYPHSPKLAKLSGLLLGS